MEYKILNKSNKKYIFFINNLGYFLSISSIFTIVILFTFSIISLIYTHNTKIYNSFNDASNIIKLLTYSFAIIKMCISFIITKICINLLKRSIWEDIILNKKIVPLQLIMEFAIGSDFITLIKYYKKINVYTIIIIIIYVLLNIMILLGNPTFSNSFSIYNTTIMDNEQNCYNKTYSLSSYWKDLGTSLNLINKNITFNKNDKWFLRYYDGLHESLIYPNIIMNSVIYNQTWNLIYKGAILYQGSTQFGMVTTNTTGFNKRQFAINSFNIYDYEKSVFISNKVNNVSSWYNKKIIRIDDEIDINNKLIFDLGSVYYDIFFNSTYCNISLGKFEEKLINGTNIASVSSFSINFIDNNIQEEIFNDICLSIIYPFTDAIRLNLSSQFTFNNNAISDMFYNIFLNPYNFFNLSSINSGKYYDTNCIYGPKWVDKYMLIAKLNIISISSIVISILVIILFFMNIRKSNISVKWRNVSSILPDLYNSNILEISKKMYNEDVDNLNKIKIKVKKENNEEYIIESVDYLDIIKK
jgi:hypothetical protein